MSLPFGVKPGLCSSAGASSDTAIVRAPDASTTSMRARSTAKAILAPSGDQAGSQAWPAPDAQSLGDPPEIDIT